MPDEVAQNIISDAFGETFVPKIGKMFKLVSSTKGYLGKNMNLDNIMSKLQQA